MALSTDSQDTTELLEEIAAGNSAALDRLLQRHRPYLLRLIQIRIDPALKARVDASDVAQDAQIAIAD